jgi:hypothetical protein
LTAPPWSGTIAPIRCTQEYWRLPAHV